MLSSVPHFTVTEEKQVSDRFDEFIEWARPNGIAQINTVHVDPYLSNAPYFAWGRSFLGNADKNTRSWFRKREFLHTGRSVFQRARGNDEPVIYNRNGLFSEGRFLEFSKAYLNVISYFRGLKSPSKPIVLALIFLEKALRDLNQNNNDPTNTKSRTFEKATRDLQESSLVQSVQYEVAKELEMLAGMLQSGYQSKSFRFDGKGFRLLDKPFAFASGISAAPRRRAIASGIGDEVRKEPKRLSTEVATAVGLAYSKAVVLHGQESTLSFMAATIGLPFITTSMRISEFLVLSRDALYLADNGTGRYRLRISRPKIGIHQDIPIPYKFGALASELFECVKAYTTEAHEAFQFYVEKFGDNFNAIDQLFIPSQFRDLFAKDYVRLEDLNTIFDVSATCMTATFPYQTLGLEMVRFVDTPGDISPLSSSNARLESGWKKIGDIELELEEMGIKTSFPIDAIRHQYINADAVSRYLCGIGRERRRKIKQEFSGTKVACNHFHTSDLRDALLKEFKADPPPHWPYVSKDKTTKLNESLFVHLLPRNGPPTACGNTRDMWWRPAPITHSSINRWTSSSDRDSPLLFERLDIRLKNGAYPEFTHHQTRKYHHTQALLAGANEVFVDELAGRTTGRQSDHYDLRTPHEILVQSIDTFDPDEDFNVIGPIADQARHIKVIDRKAFVYENAAPKHITEVGGCTTDWSLNPCDQFGSCMRCDKQVWSKGDKKRLPFIKDKRAHAIEMISFAEKKIALNDEAHALRRQLQQFKDDLARCDAILAIEADEAVAAGTIITFAAAEGAYGTSDLTRQLRQEHLQAERNK